MDFLAERAPCLDHGVLPALRLQARVGAGDPAESRWGGWLPLSAFRRQASRCYATTSFGSRGAKPDLGRRATLDQAEARADATYRAADAQYRDGGTSSDLLVREQQLIAALEAVAASDAALVQDQITTFKALGGGWAGAPTASREEVSREPSWPTSLGAEDNSAALRP